MTSAARDFSIGAGRQPLKSDHVLEQQQNPANHGNAQQLREQEAGEGTCHAAANFQANARVAGNAASRSTDIHTAPATMRNAVAAKRK